MPELPEVQTIVSDLQKIVGDHVIDFRTDWPRALQNISTAKFTDAVKNKKIISVDRKGKYIFIILDNNLTIVIHLRMTGALLLKNQESGIRNQELKSKHIHHIFFLKAKDQKSRAMEFSDVRKFATISLYNKSEPENLKKKLGIDPMQSDYTLKNFESALKSKKTRQIKDVLMDQRVIAGIGNIYASEILHEAAVLPNRRISALSDIEIKNIYIASKKILDRALKLRGTSVSDYRDASGKQGKFQEILMVYKRHTQACKKCGTIIEKSDVGQRSTFYCPRCQH